MDVNLLLTILTFTVASTIRAATPLIFAALGGIFSERSGVVNIGLEGLMLIGAFFGVYGSYTSHNPWCGVLCGVLVSSLVAMLHAVASIEFQANQVVSGMAINILAASGTALLLQQVFHTNGQTESVTKIGDWQIPGLSRLPVLGPAFGQLNPLVYLALFLVVLSSWFLFRTTTGLRLRAVGENPEAAATVGISVRKIRYLAVILSGVCSGFGGVYLSLGAMDLFKENMTAGRGFIALAAVISGKWKPGGAFLACLLFGCAETLEALLQLFNVAFPKYFLHMMPYGLTILLILGIVGRSVPPAASGLPYEGRK
jgi:ABC-type uncharacterized transport system permease subunit